MLECNNELASCPWGPVTANGVDQLTKLYVIYMETNTSDRTIMLIGPLATAGEPVTHTRKDMWKEERKDGKLGNI